MDNPSNRILRSGGGAVTAQTCGIENAAPRPMNSAEARAAVAREVTSWRGVSAEEHRFGGVAFRLGRRELGHVHGTIADLPFPRRIRDQLIAAGLARPHHVLPDSGWVTAPMRTAAEVTGVIELFRRNYQRSTKPRT